jgi:endonuclease/exonuclease/phosphatase family metal-dependent hydrolase
MKDYDARVGRMNVEIAAGIPEIIGFQEAAEWSNGQSLFNEFLKITAYSKHHRVTNSMGVMREGIGFGSKNPGENCTDLELPATSANSRQWINICEFPTTLGRIKVVNVHTSPGPWAVSHRTEQIQFIADHLTTLNSAVPIIIVGDFNDEYASVSFEALKKLGYVDVLNGEGVTYDSTQNPYAQYKRTARLDYIFYHPQQLKLVTAGFMFKENFISDHWGLKAEFSSLTAEHSMGLNSQTTSPR